MNLKLPLAAALFVGGLVLVYFGIDESNSFTSDVSEAFTGSPTDRSMWLIAGGAALTAFGGFLGLASKKPG